MLVTKNLIIPFEPYPSKNVSLCLEYVAQENINNEIMSLCSWQLKTEEIFHNCLLDYSQVGKNSEYEQSQ